MKNKEVSKKKNGFTVFMKNNKILVAVLVVFVFITGVVLPLWFFRIKPSLQIPKSGAIYSIERSPHSWKQQSISEKMKTFKINPKQMSLKDSSGKVSYCYSFQGKGATPKHTVKAVLAFGDTKSRNLIMQQHDVFGMGIKKGSLKVEYCFMQTQNEYSVLAAEALAEADYNSPSKTWKLISDFMMVNTEDLKTTEQRADMLLGILAKSGASEGKGSTPITLQSLRNGSFYEWNYASSESQRADYIPAVFIDGKVKNADLPIYEPDSMWDYIGHLS